MRLNSRCYDRLEAPTLVEREGTQHEIPKGSWFTNDWCSIVPLDLAVSSSNAVYVHPIRRNREHDERQYPRHCHARIPMTLPKEKSRIIAILSTSLTVTTIRPVIFFATSSCRRPSALLTSQVELDSLYFKRASF